MSARAGARLAWGTWALTFALAAFATVLIALSLGASTPDPGRSWPAIPLLVTALAYHTVGALVITRQPGNRVGWVFCAAGLATVVTLVATKYGDYTLFERPHSLPAEAAGAWVSSMLGPAGYSLLGLLLLLFPDGRLPSRRWRPAAFLLIAGAALGVVGYALRPGPLDAPFESVANPLGVAGARSAFDSLSGLGWLAIVVGIFLAGASLVLRLRRSRGTERQQIKWVVSAGAVLAFVFVAQFPTFFFDPGAVVESLRSVLFGCAIAGLPVAAGIAILRHRLYDIDVVINRTLVYAALTATLAGTYLATVLLLQLALRPLTSQSNLAIAASTLAVAALFRPARARIQASVDRRFFRRKYDAARTLEDFSARLREQVDLDALGGELRSVVSETMQPAHVSLWLRAPGAGR